MNQEKIGEHIKNIRKKNNLTQQEFANKYGVTYQAVSKWERGLNLPDVSLIKQICNDYNIDINDLLEVNKKNKKNIIVYIILVVLLIILSIALIIVFKDDDFEFKSLNSTCDNFTISGVVSYNNKKSSIHISNIDYCGEEDNELYTTIKCDLYEKHESTETLISSYDYNETKSINLEAFLKNVEFTIDDYERTCKDYSEENLFLRINATTKNDKIITYTIPLSLDESCKN